MFRLTLVLWIASQMYFLWRTELVVRDPWSHTAALSQAIEGVDTPTYIVGPISHTISSPQCTGAATSIAIAPLPRATRDYRPPDHPATGVVLEVTKDSITIRDGNQKTRRFAVSAWVGSTHGAPATYCLHDIELGDKIDIGYSCIDGVDVAIELLIHRRPGGRVPLSPGSDPNNPRAWHHWANARQDFEEKGIPLPHWMDPRNVPGTINGIPLQPGLIPKGAFPKASPVTPAPAPRPKQTDD